MASYKHIFTTPPPVKTDITSDIVEQELDRVVHRDTDQIRPLHPRHG